MIRHVCLIGPASNTHVQRWARALTERDLRVSLISTTPINQPLPSALRDLSCYIVPTATAGMSSGQRLLTLLRGWARIPGLIAALKPDLVHLHSLPAPAAVPFLCFIPHLVVSTWGSDVVQRDRRKTQMYPWLLAHADRITATSRYLAAVTATYLQSERPIHVVPFGVDPEQFTPAPSLPSVPRIGTLRHLEANYGLDILIAALPLLIESFPALEVAIGGAGSLQHALEAQAVQVGVAQRVNFEGRLAHADVPDFLRSLRLFVMPSRAEAFGVAALEAEACGLPVVASDVGGLPEVVRNGETGLLVPPANPRALAAAIAELLHDPQRSATMGRAARDWVIERYTWRASVQQMLDVYRQVA